MTVSLPLSDVGPAQASSIPVWRREPYRILFPVGALLSWAGVLPWVLYSTQLSGEYRSAFHAMAQIQGFLSCFAAGFLMTFLPRRTGTQAPATWQVAIGLLAPTLSTVFAFRGMWIASQGAWLVLVAVLVLFARGRVASLGPGARMPPSFVWVPIAAGAVFLGSVLATVGAILGGARHWLHQAGSATILQGLFTGLCVGIGAILLPVVIHASGNRPGSPDVQRLARARHAVLALAFFGSYYLDATVSPRLGYGLRAALVAWVFIKETGLWRLPRTAGVQRKMAAIGAGCIPVGHLLVALLPSYRQVGLHVVFIGGFTMMTFAIATHVLLSHGGRPDLLRASPKTALLTAALFATAIVARVLMVVDPPRSFVWMGLGATAFLLATVAWTFWVKVAFFGGVPGAAQVHGEGHRGAQAA